MGHIRLQKRSAREREAYLQGWLAAATHFANNTRPHSVKSARFTLGLIHSMTSDLAKLKDRKRSRR